MLSKVLIKKRTLANLSLFLALSILFQLAQNGMIFSGAILIFILLNSSLKEEKLYNVIRILILFWIGLLSRNFSVYWLDGVVTLGLLTLKVDTSNITKKLKYKSMFGAVLLIQLFGYSKINLANLNVFVFRYLLRAYDNVSHFGLIRQIAATDTVYEIRPRVLTSQGWLHYPQLWHSSFYLLFSDAAFKHLGNSLVIFALVTLLSQIFIFTLSVFNFNNMLKSKSSLVFTYVVIGLSFILYFVSFCALGAYHNFALASLVTALAFKTKLQEKRTLILIFAVLLYYNFAIFLIVDQFLNIHRNRSIYRYIKNSYKQLFYISLTLLFVVFGVIKTDQKNGLLIGSPFNLTAVRYLLLICLYALLIIKFEQVLRKKYGVANLPTTAPLISFFILFFTHIAIIGVYKVNDYFTQKMLLASIFVEILVLYQAFSLNEREISYRNSKVHAGFLWNQPRKRITFLCTSLSLIIILGPAGDYSRALVSHKLIDEFNLRKIEESNLTVYADLQNPNAIIYFENEDSGEYSSYLLMQWLSVLSDTWTDRRQFMIEKCLRDVKDIKQSKTQRKVLIPGSVSEKIVIDEKDCN